MAALTSPVPPDLPGFIERRLSNGKVIGSPGFPFREEERRARAERIFHRGLSPAGTARQMAAIVAHGDRTPGLRGLTLPTLVIHGAADPLVPLAGGEATAAAIPGAELLVIEGMGHDVPETPGHRLFQLSANSPQGWLSLWIFSECASLPGVGAPPSPQRRLGEPLLP